MLDYILIYIYYHQVIELKSHTDTQADGLLLFRIHATCYRTFNQAVEKQKNKTIAHTFLIWILCEWTFLTKGIFWQMRLQFRQGILWTVCRKGWRIWIRSSKRGPNEGYRCEFRNIWDNSSHECERVNQKNGEEKNWGQSGITKPCKKWKRESSKKVTGSRWLRKKVKISRSGFGKRRDFTSQE